MELDAELRRQIAVSLAAVLTFLAGLVFVGIRYGADTGLPEEGAIAIVGLLAGFVLLMALVGFYLIRAKDASRS